MDAKYLIIGNSAGGIGAAEAIREVDKVGSILMVSDEPYPAYSRPLISEYLAERCPLDRMLFRPADFYKKNNIQTVLGRKAQHLDIDGHVIEVDDGGKIGWKKLLLATGGSPIIPQIKGVGKNGVFSFTTIDDAKAIDQFLGQFLKKIRVVVVGGGLIGVSVTEALVKREAKVTIVEMKERILNTILDEEGSALVEESLRQAGVNIITGHTITEVTSYSADTATGVALDDGSPMPCELVIMAIGVRPRVELAAGTGIKVNRGIVVDRRMATSRPDIYACGDVAEAYDFVYGENRLTPIWPNAYIGGRIAGLNMAGVAAEYKGGTSMNSLKYFGRDIVSAGLVAPSNNGYEVLSKRSDNNYRRVVLKEGRVVGMVFAGNIEKSGIVFGLMKDGANVESFKEALVADDFGLISLPEEMRRAKLEIPAGLVPSTPEVPEEILIGE